MSFRGPLPPLGPLAPKPVHGGLPTVIVETDT
jgi:hypothetical protein